VAVADQTGLADSAWSLRAGTTVRVCLPGLTFCIYTVTAGVQTMLISDLSSRTW